MRYMFRMTDSDLRVDETDAGRVLSGPAAPRFALVNEFPGYLADRRYSPKTVRAYAFDLLAFCRWLADQDTRLADVTAETLLRYLSHCRAATFRGRPGGNVYSIRDGRSTGYAAATVNRQMAAISGMFDFRAMRDPDKPSPVPKGAARRQAGRSERSGLLGHLAATNPRLVFRNPGKVTQGWELARKQRAMFIEFFGSDLIVVPGPEVASRMNGFLAWYTRRVLEEADPAASSLDAGVAARTPAFSVPRDLTSAPTVALAYDETEGLVFPGNFALVREAFEDPGLAANPEHRRAVLGYLKADSISALPFRRLAGADTGRATQLFQHLLKKPGFSWERDGEALLRKHKPWCFEANPLPPVTPLSSELAEALPSSR